MKMTIDGTQITMNAVKHVKEDMKEFKSRYTDRDIVCHADDQIRSVYERLTQEAYPYTHDVVGIKVEAVYHDYQGTHFRVEMLLDGWDEFDKITFYADLDMNIDTEGHWSMFNNRYEYTFNVRRYKRDGALCTIITEDGERDVA